MRKLLQPALVVLAMLVCSSLAVAQNSQHFSTELTATGAETVLGIACGGSNLKSWRLQRKVGTTWVDVTGEEEDGLNDPARGWVLLNSLVAGDTYRVVGSTIGNNGPYSSALVAL